MWHSVIILVSRLMYIYGLLVPESEDIDDAQVKKNDFWALPAVRLLKNKVSLSLARARARSLSLSRCNLKKKDLWLMSEM